MAGRRRSHQAKAILAASIEPDAPTSEARWQKRIIRLGDFYGWTSYHTHDSRRSEPGFLDLTMYRPPRATGGAWPTGPQPIRTELLFAELKSPGDDVVDLEKWLARKWTPEQRDWHAALEDATEGDAHLWVWPRDYDAMHARLARHRVRVEPDWSPLLGKEAA